MKSYVSDNGLPRAVATTSALPKAAFVGHLCYVESEDAIYCFDGTEYAAVTSENNEDAVVSVQSYTGKTNFPSDAVAGQLAFSTNASSKGLYVYNGTDWDQLAIVTE